MTLPGSFYAAITATRELLQQPPPRLSPRR